MLNSYGYKSGLTTNRGNELYQAILDVDEQRVNSILSSWLKPYWADVKPVQGEAINLLIAASASSYILHAILVNYSNDILGDEKITAIETAADNGDIGSLKILLEQHGCREFISDTPFRRVLTSYWLVIGNALAGAARNGHHESVRILLEHSSKNMMADDKDRAFRDAYRNGHHDCIRVLLERCGTDISVVGKGCALLNAANNDHHDLVGVLLEWCSAEITVYYKGEALIQAARKGHHGLVLFLLERCGADLDSESKGWALKLASIEGKHDVVSTLLELCNADISVEDKGLALCRAAENGHHDVASFLIEQCSAVFRAYDKYHALEEAARYGQAVSIRLLLEHYSADISEEYKARALCNAIFSRNLEAIHALLDDPTVMAVAHLNNNWVLNEARLDAQHFQPIIDRLMQIPAVAQLANQQHHQGLDLAAEAQLAENSMMALSAPQLRLIEILKQHYKEEYEDKTWEVLSVEIKSYCEDEYSKHPAIDEHGNALPLEFTTGLSEASLLAYYQHPIHSAWRYLSRPNLWMSPEAEWVDDIVGGRVATIGDDDKALMGYIWLALNDEAVELVEGFSVTANKLLFAQNLSLLGRAHNWDKKRPILDANGNVTYKLNGKPKREYYDDLEGDKPTCGWGVTQRLLKVFYGHPYVNGPEARTLTAEIMREFMIEHMIKEKAAEDEADNLIDRLNTLPAVVLKDIHQELSDLLNLYEDYKERELTDDEQILRTNALITPELQIKAFIERCKLWYGESRINATQPVSFIGHSVEHAGYIPLIQHSLANPIMAFAQKLNKYLTKRVSELESKAPRTYLPSSPSSSSSSASCSSAHCVDDPSSAKRAKYDMRKEGLRRSKRLRNLHNS